jgi:hypothetical protein
MNRRAAAVLFTVVLVVSSAGCSKTKHKASATTTSTSAGVTTTTAAAVSTTSTRVTSPSGPAKTYDAAADGLFNTWKRGDTKANRDYASNFAQGPAIDQMFSHPYSSGTTYTKQPCAPVGGQFACDWTYPGGALELTVEAWPGGGYVVSEVVYRAD